ncbi:hypothetical protein EMMF5_003249 [Cystobasidiomycetes sp. EMM_F5]
MEALLAQAQTLAKTVTESNRKALIDGLRDLATSLEDNQESAQRLIYTHYPLIALRIGSDLNLFSLLADAEKPLTSSEIAQKTGAAPQLMARLLRYMASARLIKEADVDTFTANNVTRTFAIPGWRSAVYHQFDYTGRALNHLPEYLKEHKYKDIVSPIDCPLTSAWKTDLHPFAHLLSQTELFGHFQQFMSVQRMGMPTWLDVYPYKAAASNLAPERVLFVDVGGGIGHQSVALREALPNVPNKIILQDMEQVIPMAIKHPGIEAQAHDFFQPQPVKGAKMYYMRNILHDWREEQCLEILKQLKAVLADDSVILIDEMYLPLKGVHWQATQLDLTMMSCLSSMERNEAQWQDLISKAGLKIKKVYKYTDSLSDAIIEVVPA